VRRAAPNRNRSHQHFATSFLERASAPRPAGGSVDAMKQKQRPSRCVPVRTGSPVVRVHALSDEQLPSITGGTGNISGGKAPPEPQPHI
jgi:hypothetical protein